LSINGLDLGVHRGRLQTLVKATNPGRRIGVIMKYRPSATGRRPPYSMLMPEAALVAELLASLDGPADPEAENAWNAED